jgi:hypothetical protein
MFFKINSWNHSKDTWILKQWQVVICYDFDILLCFIVKVKFTPEQAIKAQMVCRLKFI